MKEKDVSTRSRLVESGEFHDEVYHPVMKADHEENNKRIKEIIYQLGWPKESEVGVTVAILAILGRTKVTY